MALITGRREIKVALREGEYVDPNLRQAVSNVASAAMLTEDNPDAAIAKGLLKIEKPAEYSSGSPLNEAITRRARDKFYDPQISEGLQKMKYKTDQIGQVNSAINNVMGIYKLDRQAEEITRQRKAAEDAQRAQVLSSVLGLGGAVAGAMLGGPAGAAVGAQAGSTIGAMGSKSNNTMSPG